MNLEAPFMAHGLFNLTLLVFEDERCLYTGNCVGIHEQHNKGQHTSVLLLPSSSKMAVLSLAQRSTAFVCKPAVKPALHSLQNLS